MISVVMKLPAYYYIIINIIGFSVMGIDKKRAIRGAWRISEASLFLTALAGGALGCTLGMYHFRHKTRRRRFRLGFPGILVLQVSFMIYILMSG